MTSLRSAAGVASLVALAAACTLSTGGTGTGSSSSAGMACQPSAQEPCYSGPAGTEGVGPCKAGSAECAADGTWGACSGEVLPVSEDCATPIDDNCDGTVNEIASGCVCKAKEVGPCYSGPPATIGIGACKAGTALCSADGKSEGACMGAVLPSFDDCVTNADEDCDGKLVSCTGDTLWSHTWGGTLDDHVYALAVDGAGDSFVAGGFQKSADLGGTMLTSDGDVDVFLAEYDPTGKVLFAKSFGDDKYQLATAAAVTADGGAVIAGEFKGVLNLGGADLTSEGTGLDVFVAKFDKLGKHVWSKRFGDWQDQSPSSVAVDDKGNVGLTGYFYGTLNFDAGASTLTSAGDKDIFVVELDQGGAYRWSASYGDSLEQRAYAAAFDGSGDLIVVGGVSGTLDFGGGLKAVSAGNVDAYIVSFDPTGKPLWCRTFGDGSYQAFFGVTATPAGDVVVTGGVDGAVDFGGGALPAGGNLDLLVARFDKNGAYKFAVRAGDSQQQYGLFTRLDPAGNILVTGSFQGTMDLGGGATKSAGGYDAFAAKLDPGGAFVWMKQWGDAQDQGGVRVAADSYAHVFVAGEFHGGIDFGAGPDVTNGGTDAFLVKLAP